MRGTNDISYELVLEVTKIRFAGQRCRSRAAGSVLRSISNDVQGLDVQDNSRHPTPPNLGVHQGTVVTSPLHSKPPHRSTPLRFGGEQTAQTCDMAGLRQLSGLKHGRTGKRRN
jgi:hypothetical protein